MSKTLEKAFYGIMVKVQSDDKQEAENFIFALHEGRGIEELWEVMKKKGLAMGNSLTEGKLIKIQEIEEVENLTASATEMDNQPPVH